MWKSQMKDLHRITGLDWNHHFPVQLHSSLEVIFKPISKLDQSVLSFFFSNLQDIKNNEIINPAIYTEVAMGQAATFRAS